jgi:aminoglycoside/choline kinase family phosphotransferase
MNSVDDLKELFAASFGASPEEAELLDPQLGASGRKLIRLGDGKITAIGVIYDVHEENVAFLSFSRHFRRHGLPVPRIYAEDLEKNVYLEEDLGNTTLYQFLGEKRSGDAVGSEAVEAYRKVVAVLPQFQVKAGRDLDYSVCYPRNRFDRQSIVWDLNYFKYHFLKLIGISFNEQSLEDDFSRLSDFLLEVDDNYFMYRDFQSRNVMLQNGEPFFLDYQGGRRGPLQYDVASLLFDAKADLSPVLRADLLEAYLAALGDFVDVDHKVFMRHYYEYVFIRILQALGAYGYRGLFERKELFVASIPYALRNIDWLLANVDLHVDMPTLRTVFEDIRQSGKFLSVPLQPT